jgi:hypothetical protein
LLQYSGTNLPPKEAAVCYNTVALIYHLKRQQFVTIQWHLSTTSRGSSLLQDSRTNLPPQQAAICYNTVALIYHLKRQQFAARQWQCSAKLHGVTFLTYIYIYIYIYINITRLVSNEMFSRSNKIYREVGWAKDLSTLRYLWHAQEQPYIGFV